MNDISADMNNLLADISFWKNYQYDTKVRYWLICPPSDMKIPYPRRICYSIFKPYKHVLFVMCKDNQLNLLLDFEL